MLESVEGLSWSSLVFDELEWRIEDARDELVLQAKNNSQWRSLIQVFFIVLASVSVGLVWLKLSTVAQKGML